MCTREIDSELLLFYLRDKNIFDNANKRLDKKIPFFYMLNSLNVKSHQ